MSNRRTVAITDFLTAEEIERAWKLFENAEASTFARRCAKEIIEPILPQINAKLGQENAPLFLAYAVQHVFNSATGWESKHALKGE